MYDSRDVREWSGLPFHISNCLAAQGAEVKFFCPLVLGETRVSRFGLRIKKWIHRRVLKKEMFEDKDPSVLRGFARQLQKRLREDPVDVLFAISPVSVAALATDVPVCFWSDATCAALRGFYPEYDRLSAWSFRDWERMERMALQRANLAIYASRWAAKSAHDDYDCPLDRIEVVPFGANLDDIPSRDEVAQAVAGRSATVCKFLFIGKDWGRKGGDLVVETARIMQEWGIAVEVHLVGSRPPAGRELPDFAIDHGHLCKTRPEHRHLMRKLLLESHFLFVPSVAECFGVVYCEAAAHGLPSLARAVGGTPDAVLDGRTGKLFAASAPADVFAEAAGRLFRSQVDYGALALGSREAYEQGLNWDVIGRRVINRLEKLLTAR